MNQDRRNEILSAIRKMDATELGNELRQYVEESEDHGWEGVPPEHVVAHYRLLDDFLLYVDMKKD